MNRINLQLGDITQLEVDAIVNAANEQLSPGSGVDGAIHTAAGPGFADECETLGVCSTGEARITGGHNLEAKHIIHTVGPIWEDGHENEPQLLEIATKTPSASPQKMAFALLHSLQSVLGLTTSHRIKHP